MHLLLIKGQTWLDDIMMSATSAAVVDQVQEEITAMLRERLIHSGDGLVKIFLIAVLLEAWRGDLGEIE